MKLLPKKLSDILTAANGKAPIMSCEDYIDARSRKVGHVLLDVRTVSEFESGHIEGAINIPLDVLSERVQETVLNKATPVMVYCKTGVRATTASLMLLEMGYSDVRVLEGGYVGYCKM